MKEVDPAYAGMIPLFDKCECPRGVDPAYAGMILRKHCGFIDGLGGPRVCGDDPSLLPPVAFSE